MAALPLATSAVSSHSGGRGLGSTHRGFGWRRSSSLSQREREGLFSRPPSPTVTPPPSACPAGDTGANILHHRQHLTRYAANQAKALWERYPIGEAADVHIGVLGLGSIGVRIAETLVGFEFKVSGWARGPHQIAGVDCHYGPDALAPLLANLDYVVCVLPGTTALHHFFNAERFAGMKDGAIFINVGRGPVVDPDALIGALDAGPLGGAVLDVFETEPLAADSPLWRHPKILITPHAAGGPAMASMPDILENYRRAAAGEPLINLADPEQGY